MPVEQVSGQLQIRPNLAIGAYYQLIGSATGSRRGQLLLESICSMRAASASSPVRQAGRRSALVRPQHQGHRGRAACSCGCALRAGRRVRALCGAIPRQEPVSSRPGAGFTERPGRHYRGFPEDIPRLWRERYTTIGDANIGGEMSCRTNMPLVRRPRACRRTTAAITATTRSTLWANRARAVSFVSCSSPRFLAGWQLPRRDRLEPAPIGHSQRGGARPERDRNALAIRMVFQPRYPRCCGLDLSMPIGVGYGLSGRSSVSVRVRVEHGGESASGSTAST